MKNNVVVTDDGTEINLDFLRRVICGELSCKHYKLLMLDLAIPAVELNDPKNLNHITEMIAVVMAFMLAPQPTANQNAIIKNFTSILNEAIVIWQDRMQEQMKPDEQ